LKDTQIISANVSGADFTRADLRGVELDGASISEKWKTIWKIANGNFDQRISLYRKDLSRAFLQGANMRDFQLNEVYLAWSDLTDADLTKATLTRANLNGTIMRGVILSDANLSYADLRYADLSGANLQDVDWEGAILDNANFEGAQNTSKEILEGAASLKGATMPDGSKHD
jgi:uncharacterized protein YjbI with pentapeptide repeats